MQEMPKGSYTRRLSDNEFKPKSSVRMAIEWLEWVAHKEGIHIRHQLNNTEKRIGGRKLPVDGFNAQTQTVYQFHACYWHGHDCGLNRGKEYNEKRDKPMAKIREETRANSEYIRSKGYNVVEMYECQWREMKKANCELQRFIATEVKRTLDKVKIMSPERILSEVRRERFFGCVEVDMRVPDHLKEKFSEMCPILIQEHKNQLQLYWRLHESVRRRTQHYGPASAKLDWEYARGKYAAGHPPPQVVPGTWFRGHQSAPSDRAHP